MSKRLDVLNLEWTSFPSRDRQVAVLVCNYLRYFGYNVLEEPVFNGLHYLNKYRPKILFLTNPHGGEIEYNLICHAKDRGFTMVELIAEGDVSEDITLLDQFIWGFNARKEIMGDIKMLWSERSRKMVLSKYPELSSKLKVSGSVGFDTYNIAKCKHKEAFLAEYDKNQYSKVIGIGCWDFGAFYSKEDTKYELRRKRYTQKEIDRFLEDFYLFNSIMHDVVKNNPDTLFLIKLHPQSELGIKAGGVEGLENYPNTLILNLEEAIIDCINVSDLWFVYNSTTLLEAWLLNKKTATINPTGTDFPRRMLYKGCPNFTNADDLQSAIDQYYVSKELPGFAELKDKRERLIKDIGEQHDGLNHVRVGNEILDILEKGTYSKKIRSSNLFIKCVRPLLRLMWWYSPWARKLHLPVFESFADYNRKIFNYQDLKAFQDKRLKEQIDYYHSLGISKEGLRKIRCI